MVVSVPVREPVAARNGNSPEYERQFNLAHLSLELGLAVLLEQNLLLYS